MGDLSRAEVLLAMRVNAPIMEHIGVARCPSLSRSLPPCLAGLAFRHRQQRVDARFEFPVPRIVPILQTVPQCFRGLVSLKAASGDEGSDVGEHFARQHTRVCTQGLSNNAIARIAGDRLLDVLLRDVHVEGRFRFPDSCTHDSPLFRPFLRNQQIGYNWRCYLSQKENPRGFSRGLVTRFIGLWHCKGTLHLIHQFHHTIDATD